LLLKTQHSSLTNQFHIANIMIVLVDVRGTGKSNPLNCSSLQIKHGLKEQF